MIDLLVIGKNAHVISSREAVIWSTVWISLGLSFYFVLLHFGDLFHGIDSKEKLLEIVGKYNHFLVFKSSDYTQMLYQYRKVQGLNYLSGYFIEKTLSVDNIFVMLMILQGFSVPLKDYKLVLFWGILRAIVLRFVFYFCRCCFFSNIFAILGLRSLFFLVANIVNKFRFLKAGISVLLIFIVFKLVFHEYLVHVGFKPEYSLYVIGAVLV